ncbi:docking domain of Afi1 for Arf3 in vesicle trafficking-domain-containing protein [Blyttiomyces helicus]|uniref:Docking domain of Afi1 for Arf3 in vesicle trafficking-domain-containing protein n=1 Tax=Blyttiomyces helicus TaxID=388810 RepID=A0A4P9WLR7_9FUNG|nr:docking domain of Afi1 for Arf3 in vesicle trafficking-domain-containing protein [Blyttiomyces helicus]|eukprot:RKO93362.1 docking domain of Afi1 for Arf3 in vesicle trafficking-domain-containing protein [Blyttiomyces helicus]
MPCDYRFRHCDHILVAEFDIDKGSSLTHQYPCPTGTDTHILAELMLPDGAHVREEDWTMFFLNQRAPPLPLLYSLNLVRTKHISGVRRGARVKAMAIVSRHQWVHVFKPLLVLALEKYFVVPSADILAALFTAINAMDVSVMPRFSIIEKRILRASEDKTMLEEKFHELEDRVAAARRLIDRRVFATKVEYDGIMVPIKIPLTSFPDEIGDVGIASMLSWKNGAPYYWHPHLDSGPQTHPICVLINALLTQKRVLFLGHNRPSGEVVDYVLAACALASGGGIVLRGFKERCFPYASLAALEGLLAVPGYIAGVTNPVFEEQGTWWDVLCNINTGKITISPKLVAAAASDEKEPAGKDREREKEWMRAGCWEGDNDFAAEAMAASQSHMGELYIRRKFHRYVHRLVDVTAAIELESFGSTAILATAADVSIPELGVGPFFVDDASKRRELFMLRNRVDGWRRTRSYKYRQNDYQSFLRRRTLYSFDARYAFTRFRYASSLPDPLVVRMFLALQDTLALGSDAQVLELLCPKIHGEIARPYRRA